MSRSQKKKPYCPTACCKAIGMKKYKLQVRRVERKTKDIPSGSSFKKLVSCWLRPDDGNWFRDEPKGYRK